MVYDPKNGCVRVIDLDGILEGREVIAMREVHVGDHVIWVDPVGRTNNALVTAVWSQKCINVVMVSDDPKKDDVYGRQIERQTSQSYKDGMPHGNYWMFPDDEQNPVVQALEK